MTQSTPLLSPVSDVDAPAIERLLDAAFGTDRRGRTAYRLRAGAAPRAELGLIARDGAGGLAGVLQCWTVALWPAGEAPVPIVLVGPVAVDPAHQGKGVGTAMLREVLARMDAAGTGASMLIGDPGYYGRFGYTAAATGGWSLPGPVERQRLLARVRPGTVLPEVARVGAPPMPMRRAG